MVPACILAIEDEDDRVFMENLYHSYERLMFYEVLGIVKNRGVVDDIVQEVLVHLILKLPTLRRLDPPRRTGYIIAACRHRSYNFLRDSKRHAAFPLDEARDAAQEESIENILLSKEALEKLADVWPRLDARTRYILEGYYILRIPSKELARTLGITPASFRMALTRARRKAFRLLSRELGETL